MRFQVLTLVTAALSATSALAQSVATPSTTPIPSKYYPASRVEQQIDELTAAAGISLATVQQLRTGINIGLIGKPIVDSFRALVHEITSDTLTFGVLPKMDYTDEAQGKICTSYKQLISLNGQIIQAFFDQAHITTGTDYQGPLHALLRVFEGSVTRYNNHIIKQVPSCADSVNVEMGKLLVVLKLAIVAI